MSVVSSLSLIAGGEVPSPFAVSIWGHSSAPQKPTGCPPAPHPAAFQVLSLLIHVFLSFVNYGEKGKMNGRSLIGGAGDAPCGLWKDSFGVKVGEAAHRGFSWQSVAQAHGPPEQVRSVSGLPLPPGMRVPALHSPVCLS